MHSSLKDVCEVTKRYIETLITVGLGGLGVTCSPRDPRFVGSNPAQVDGSTIDLKKGRSALGSNDHPINTNTNTIYAMANIISPPLR